MYKIWMASLLLIAAATAHATIDSKSGKAPEKPAIDVTAPFDQQARIIETELADGETYSEISQKDREAVRAALQRISTALASAGGVDSLTAAQKASVFNDQELANNILTMAGNDSRVICKREKKVGSNRTTTQCATVAERRRAAEQSEKALRENQRIQLPAAG